LPGRSHDNVPGRMGHMGRQGAMPTIRRATVDDLEELTRLRLALFRDMGELRDEHETADLAEAVRHFLATDLPAGRFIAWVALDDEETTIGCGGLVFVQKPPSTGNYSGREAYLMNMYTVPEWRGRGIATQLMPVILDFVRDAGVARVRLHATEPGRPIYERAGFRPTGTEMILTIGREKGGSDRATQSGQGLLRGGPGIPAE
jgi:GNAT superfamily N-acetyltransferase